MKDIGNVLDSLSRFAQLFIMKKSQIFLFPFHSRNVKEKLEFFLFHILDHSYFLDGKKVAFLVVSFDV